MKKPNKNKINPETLYEKTVAIIESGLNKVHIKKSLSDKKWPHIEIKIQGNREVLAYLFPTAKAIFTKLKYYQGKLVNTQENKLIKRIRTYAIRLDYKNISHFKNETISDLRRDAEFHYRLLS